MSTDNEELQQYLTPPALEEDSDTDLSEIPKTPEGKPAEDELDIQYSSKFDMEDFESSPPASQLEPRHKKHYQYMNESSQPKESAKNRRPNRKRKHIDTVSLETNITKSKDSIRKLEQHMKDKTCPKSFQYSARANIPPDETFVKDIKRVKEEAEQGFVNALLKYHKRRLNGQENKLKKAKLSKKTSTIASTDVNRSMREQSHSANTENIVNHDVHKVDKLQQEFNELRQILYEHVLQNSANNKNVEKYDSLISENLTAKTGVKNKKGYKTNNKRKERRKKMAKKRIETQRKNNEKFIKNFSNQQLSDSQVSVLSKGLKFVPTPATDENYIRRKLLLDFEHFARRMRLKYIFHKENKEPHPFHVKSDWNPPVQKSVALESYLESVKIQLAEIKPVKPKNNLSHNEYKALTELKKNTNIVLKKADKGTTTVIMNKCDKIQEAQIQLNNREHYKLLRNSITVETSQRVHELVAQLHQNNFIDDMTRKWFSQTRDPPRIPIFYTLTKIHKPNPVGRPIISGCEGPTERLSFFVDKLLQPIAQKQKSYLKDTTDFVNFIEKTKVSQDAILVSMDVTSLYTNIPQEEGITTVCRAYQAFHNNNPPIPSHYLKEMLKLILEENSFQFIGNNYLQTHGTAMGTKMAVAFANIFMADIETKMISQSKTKPIEWKRFIDDIFSLWDSDKKEINLFIEQANNFHPTIKFTAEISDNETTFLDTIIFKGERFRNESILDIRTHYKPTETFQYTHFTSSHPLGVKRGFIKGEALRLLRTNSSEATFEESISNFKSRLITRGYPHKMIQTTLSEVNFAKRQSALQQKKKTRKQILPFVTTYHPSVRNLKNILMQNWNLIQNQPLLKSIFKDPPIISYKRGQSLKDMLVRAKI